MNHEQLCLGPNLNPISRIFVLLLKVTGVFARRGYNVQSLAVGPSERDGMSRISTVIPGDGPSVSKLVKQLNKVVGVQQVTDITDLPFVSLELMLIKVLVYSTNNLR